MAVTRSSRRTLGRVLPGTRVMDNQNQDAGLFDVLNLPSTQQGDVVSPTTAAGMFPAVSYGASPIEQAVTGTGYGLAAANRAAGRSPIEQAAMGIGYGGLGAPSVLKNVDTAGEQDAEDFQIQLNFGGGGGGGISASDALAARKFEAEQKAAADAIARQRTGAEAQLAYLRGQLTAGVPSTISGEISEQERIGREAITTQAQALADLISGRRTQGLEELGRGYGSLATYLQQNAPQAFAQAERAQPQTVQSALAQYMAGQGVSPAVAQEAANIANVQAAGGAANFNQLLDVLAAREAAAQQSRLAEAEMSRAAGVRGLETLYGTATSQLEQQRLAALADLNARISGARLQAQQQATARQQAVQDAINQLIGTGLIAPGTDISPTETPITSTPAKPTPIQQLAAKAAGIQKPALKKEVQNFVAANPNATQAQIQKKFPSLGANITR